MQQFLNVSNKLLDIATVQQRIRILSENIPANQ